MSLKQKEERLRKAIQKLNDNPTKEDVIDLIVASALATRQGVGMIWSEIEKAVNEEFKQKSCKTCEYWSRGDCSFCDEFEDANNPKRFDIDFYCHDDSGLELTLKTGSDFYCIHHKSS